VNGKLLEFICNMWTSHDCAVENSIHIFCFS